jgi:serine/threonine protein kinase
MFEEKTAQTLMRNILEALVTMHENDVVHRDIKPENFVFDNQESDVDLKLTNFELASFVR